MKTEKIVIFSILGAIMFCSKFITDILPNINLLSVLVISYTLVYKKQALIPIYIYVILNGIFVGFATWWLPYIYIWFILWAFTMLIPEEKINDKILTVICCLVCSLFGLIFGTIYAPFQALCFGLTYDEMIAWILAGLPFDIVHAISNLFLGLLIVPLKNVLKKY